MPIPTKPVKPSNSARSDHYSSKLSSSFLPSSANALPLSSRSVHPPSSQSTMLHSHQGPCRAAAGGRVDENDESSKSDAQSLSLSSTTTKKKVATATRPTRRRSPNSLKAQHASTSLTTTVPSATLSYDALLHTLRTVFLDNRIEREGHNIDHNLRTIQTWVTTSTTTTTATTEANRNHKKKNNDHGVAGGGGAGEEGGFRPYLVENDPYHERYVALVEAMRLADANEGRVQHRGGATSVVLKPFSTFPALQPCLPTSQVSNNTAAADVTAVADSPTAVGEADVPSQSPPAAVSNEEDRSRLPALSAARSTTVHDDPNRGAKDVSACQPKKQQQQLGDVLPPLPPLDGFTAHSAKGNSASAAPPLSSHRRHLIATDPLGAEPLPPSSRPLRTTTTTSLTTTAPPEAGEEDVLSSVTPMTGTALDPPLDPCRYCKLHHDDPFFWEIPAKTNSSASTSASSLLYNHFALQVFSPDSVMEKLWLAVGRLRLGGSDDNEPKKGDPHSPSASQGGKQSSRGPPQLLLPDADRRAILLDHAAATCRSHFLRAVGLPPWLQHFAATHHTHQRALRSIRRKVARIAARSDEINVDVKRIVAQFQQTVAFRGILQQQSAEPERVRLEHELHEVKLKIEDAEMECREIEKKNALDAKREVFHRALYALYMEDVSRLLSSVLELYHFVDSLDRPGLLQLQLKQKLGQLLQNLPCCEFGRSTRRQESAYQDSRKEFLDEQRQQQQGGEAGGDSNESSWSEQAVQRLKTQTFLLKPFQCKHCLLLTSYSPYCPKSGIAHWRMPQPMSLYNVVVGKKGGDNSQQSSPTTVPPPANHNNSNKNKSNTTTMRSFDGKEKVGRSHRQADKARRAATDEEKDGGGRRGRGDNDAEGDEDTSAKGSSPTPVPSSVKSSAQATPGATPPPPLGLATSQNDEGGRNSSSATELQSQSLRGRNGSSPKPPPTGSRSPLTAAVKSPTTAVAGAAAANKGRSPPPLSEQSLLLQAQPLSSSEDPLVRLGGPVGGDSSFLSGSGIGRAAAQKQHQQQHTTSSIFGTPIDPLNGSSSRKDDERPLWFATKEGEEGMTMTSTKQQQLLERSVGSLNGSKMTAPLDAQAMELLQVVGRITKAFLDAAGKRNTRGMRDVVDALEQAVSNGNNNAATPLLATTSAPLQTGLLDAHALKVLSKHALVVKALLEPMQRFYEWYLVLTLDRVPTPPRSLPVGQANTVSSSTPHRLMLLRRELRVLESTFAKRSRTTQQGVILDDDALLAMVTKTSELERRNLQLRHRVRMMTEGRSPMAFAAPIGGTAHHSSKLHHSGEEGGGGSGGGLQSPSVAPWGADGAVRAHVVPPTTNLGDGFYW